MSNRKAQGLGSLRFLLFKSIFANFVGNYEGMNDPEKIGSAVKQQRTETLYSYTFPLMQIDADISRPPGHVIFMPIAHSYKTVVAFESLSNNYGASNAVEYCDQLALLGLYSNPVPESTLGTSNMQSAFEVQGISLWEQALEKLDTIVFLLKQIAK